MRTSSPGLYPDVLLTVTADDPALPVALTGRFDSTTLLVTSRSPSAPVPPSTTFGGTVAVGVGVAVKVGVGSGCVRTCSEAPRTDGAVATEASAPYEKAVRTV